MKITILGCGVFGCGLANLFNNASASITMYSPNENEVNELLKTRRNEKIDFSIPNEIDITSNLKNAIENSNLIVFAIPTYAIESVCEELKSIVDDDVHYLIASKGINDDGSFISEIVHNILNTDKIAVISGPTFAKDLVNGSIIGFTIASVNNDTKTICECMRSDKIKLEIVEDLIGVQICGAIKNVIAIASGILGGINASDSTNALFLTEAINSIKDLIKACNGEEKTVLSLAGFGDFLMTCTSENSRNYTYGKLIGEGKIKDAKEYERNTTVEGIHTLKSVKALINKNNIKNELIDLLDDIINERKEKEELLTYIIK